MEPFALHLTTVRERLGKSQKEVAKRLGVSPSLVSKWEKGERKPDTVQFWELSRVFGVSPFYLQNAKRVVSFQPRSQAARGADDKTCFGEALNDAAQQIHHLYEVWDRAG
jgi:transcriptional regulator with XRE-family HTH domain